MNTIRLTDGVYLIVSRVLDGILDAAGIAPGPDVVGRVRALVADNADLSRRLDASERDRVGLLATLETVRRERNTRSAAIQQCHAALTKAGVRQGDVVDRVRALIAERDALRALARPDVGLPEGWTDGGTMRCKGGEVLYTAYGPSGCYARLEIWPDGVATWSQFRAPPAVYLHLLRAAGVAS